MLKEKKTGRGRRGEKELTRPGQIPFFNDWDYRVFAAVNGIKLKGRE